MIIHGLRMDSPSALLHLLFLVVVTLSADPDLMGNVVEEAISAERGKFHIKELTATDARRILEGLKEKDLAIVADSMEEKMGTNSSEKSQESFQTTEKMEILETTTAEITAKPSRPHHLFANAVAPMVLNNRGGPIKEMLDMILTQKNLLTTQRTTVTTTPSPTTSSSAPSSASLLPIIVETTKVTERPKEQAKTVTTVVVAERGADRKDSVLATLSPLLRESDKVTVSNRKLLRNPLQKRNRQPALRHEITSTTSTSTTTTEAPTTTTMAVEQKEEEKENSGGNKTETLKTDAVKVPKGEQTRKTTPSTPVRRQPPLKTLPLRQIPRKAQKSSRGPVRNNNSRGHQPHSHHQQQQRRPAAQRQQPEEPPLSLLIIRNGRLLQLTSSQQRDLDVVIRSLVPLSDVPLRRFQRNSP